MTIQLADTETVAQLWAALVSGRVGYATWAELAVVTSRPVGALAQTDASDAGTHIDPVTALSVDNAGVYRRTVLGWTRIADIPEQTMIDITALEAQIDALQAEVDAFDPTPPPAAFAKYLLGTTAHEGFFEGDSKGVRCGWDLASSTLFWASTFGHFDFKYDPQTRNYGVSGGLSDNTEAVLPDAYGNNIARGMLHPYRLARVDAAIAAGCTWAGVKIGSNDVDPVWTPTNIATWHAGRRAAGLRFLFLWIIEPNTSVTTTALDEYYAGRNAAIRAYAEANADVFLVDTASVMVDQANAHFTPLGQAGNNAGDVTDDGLHESTYGAYLGGTEALLPAMDKVFPRRVQPGLAHATDKWHATRNPRGNVLTNPLLIGVTGYGVGVTPDDVANDWLWVLPAPITATLATVSDSWMNGVTGRTDWTCPELTFSGTPGGLGQIVIQHGNSPVTGLGVIGAKLDAEMVVSVENLTGITSFSLGIQPNTYGSPVFFWGKQISSPSAKLPTLNGLLRIRMPAPWIVPNYIPQPVTGLSLALNMGVEAAAGAVTGKLRIHQAWLRPAP